MQYSLHAVQSLKIYNISNLFMTETLIPLLLVKLSMRRAVGDGLFKYEMINFSD